MDIKVFYTCKYLARRLRNQSLSQFSKIVVILVNAVIPVHQSIGKFKDDANGAINSTYSKCIHVCQASMGGFTKRLR